MEGLYKLFHSVCEVKASETGGLCYSSRVGRNFHGEKPPERYWHRQESNLEVSELN